MALDGRLLAVVQAIGAQIKQLKTDVAGKGTGNVSSTTITKVERLTQAQYNALATKDANTLYVIVG